MCCLVCPYFLVVNVSDVCGVWIVLLGVVCMLSDVGVWCLVYPMYVLSKVSSIYVFECVWCLMCPVVWVRG